MPWNTKSKNRLPEMKPKKSYSIKYGTKPKVKRVKRIKRVDYDTIKPWKIKY